MYKIILSLFLSISLNSGFSQIWNQRFDFPSSPRSSAAGFSNGNYGYLCGGSLNNSLHYNQLWKYDPSSDR